MATGVVTFTCLIFVLGFFMSLGKAAVYKHIPVYYPENVGSVGGLVGMIGGLGGFVLPIAFGALNDLTGIWTSCFMLLFLIAGGSLLWMHFAIQRMERAALATGLHSYPNSRKWSRSTRRSMSGPLRTRIGGMEARRPGILEEQGPRHRPTQFVDLDSALLLAFAIWMVWSVVVAKLPAVGFKFTNDQLFWLAAMPGLSGATLASSIRSCRRSSAGGFGRRFDLVADRSGGRHRPCGAKPRHALHFLPVARAALWLRRRQLRLLDGQYQLLLPEGGEGQCARAECWLGQSWC